LVTQKKKINWKIAVFLITIKFLMLKNGRNVQSTASQFSVSVITWYSDSDYFSRCKRTAYEGQL